MGHGPAGRITALPAAVERAQEAVLGGCSSCPHSCLTPCSSAHCGSAAQKWGSPSAQSCVYSATQQLLTIKGFRSEQHPTVTHLCRKLWQLFPTAACAPAHTCCSALALKQQVEPKCFPKQRTSRQFTHLTSLKSDDTITTVLLGRR